MLSNEEVWLQRVPADVVAALREWTETAAVNLAWRAWLSGGSGSAVARVRTETQTENLDQVLKLIPPDLGNFESRNVNLAKQYSPIDFFKKHIIPTTVSQALPGSRWYLHVQDVGGGDVTNWVPLVDIINDRNLGEHCAAIIRSMHLEWNEQSRFGHRIIDVAEHVRAAIKDYLGPGGGLDIFIQEADLNLEEHNLFTTFPGRKEQLPNPLALLQPSGTKVEIWFGRGHGDLHVQNLIVPTNPLNSDLYKLLDLGRFSYEAPLARDPMKLLGSVATQWLSALAPNTDLRRRLAELIVEPDEAEETPPTVGYREVSRRIHAASEVFALKSAAGHDWPAQKLIALAVVALRLTSQPTRFPSLADRWWFFEVAALATRAFRKYNQLGGTINMIPTAIHTTSFRDQTGIDNTLASQEEPPQAKIILLRPRTSLDATPELLTQLLRGIEDLPGSASSERLADIGEGLRALATRLDQALSDTHDTFEVQLELRTLHELLIRLSNAVIAHKVLPNVRRAGEELRRCADQRWTPVQD